MKTAKFFNDIDEGANAAVYDFVSGILGLAVMLAKIDLALRVAIVTVPFGTTPQWVKDTGKEAIEGVLGIAQILKNPGRTLAALGQKATDAVEEKGIPYVVSYTVTDLAIGRLVDWGIGKLRGLDKADDLSKISTKLDDVVDVADDLGDVVKVVDDLGDAAKVADDLGDAAKVMDDLEDIAKVADDIEVATKAVDKINNVEKVADEIGDVAGVGGLEGSIGAEDIIQYERLKSQYAANEIANAERIGSGLKSDPYHRAASFIPEEQLAKGRTFTFTNGDGRKMTMLQVEGELNGATGIYEYILNPGGQVEHQLFKPGAGVIGPN